MHRDRLYGHGSDTKIVQQLFSLVLMSPTFVWCHQQMSAIFVGRCARAVSQW